MSELTRRDALRLLGTIGATAYAASCGDNVAGDDLATAVFEPSASGALIAVWARRARTVRIVVGDVDRTVALDDSGIGAIELTGLAAATSYQVTIHGDDGAFAHHQFQTAPADNDVRPVRLAVVADYDPNPDFDSPLIDLLLARRPELIVSLGDFPYCDNGPAVATTVPAYRARHIEARTSPPIRRLHAGCAMRAIYDDHEFRNNWDAAFAAAEPDRLAAALTVWSEFFPLPAGSTVNYRNWRWGSQVECFLLDTRRYRSANAAPDGPAKTMLGSAQYSWLIDRLTASTARHKLVFTSVPLDFASGDDSWSKFAFERKRLLDAVAAIPGVVFFAGDQHWFAAHRHAHGIREFQIGPLARGLGTPTVTGDGVLFRAVEFNVAFVDATPDNLTITAIGATGNVIYREVL